MFLFREITLSEKSELRISLKHIYGISWYKSNLIINKLGLSFPYYGGNLNSYNINVILYLLKGLILSDARIKRIIENNIINLITIESYRGYRHKLALPVRGQRTRTNAGTQRSKRFKDY